MAPNEIVKSYPKPGVGSAYSSGWRQLWKNFLELFLIGIIAFLISLPLYIGQWAGDMPGQFDFNFVNEPLTLLVMPNMTNVLIIAGMGLLVLAYAIFVNGPVEFGVSFAYLKAARSDKIEIKDIFAAFKNYWNAVLASLLVFTIVVIGLVLFIVPGILFACKLAFTPYLVVDKKMEVIEAVKESWRMTRGYAWKIFLIGLLGIPIGILGLLCLGVGIIIAIMWISIAFAVFYHAVEKSREASD